MGSIEQGVDWPAGIAGVGGRCRQTDGLAFALELRGGATYTVLRFTLDMRVSTSMAEERQHNSE
ncbi:MAG: hypothetical protein KKB37_08405 [Alphaproteobacteria bacterium]|nr:hypothetical protein [Alphaproteobacteria bacterium]